MKMDKQKYIDIKLKAKNCDKTSDFSEFDCPKKLYKYTTVNNNTICSLVYNELWCSKPEYLNDPYECTIGFDKNKYDDEEMQYIENEYKTLKRLTQRTTTICSLSEENNSMLLWSHYANEHKGICIEYDFEELDNRTNNLLPVLYRENMLYLHDKEFELIKPNIIKSYHWSYEKEWRVVEPIFELEYEEEEQFLNVAGKIINASARAVYLGTRISYNDLRVIKEVVKNKNIKLYQAEIEEGLYKIIFKEIK